MAAVMALATCSIALCAWAAIIGACLIKGPDVSRLVSNVLVSPSHISKGFAQFLGGLGRSLVTNRSLEFLVTLRHPTPGADHLLGDVLFKDHLRWDIATAALHGSICHSHSLMISQICTQTAIALSRCPRTEKEACSCLFRNERDRRQSPDAPELPTPCSAQP